MSKDGMSWERDDVNILRVRNGWLVTAGYSFQSNGPRDSADEWRVFESFDALVRFLDGRWPRVESGKP